MPNMNDGYAVDTLVSTTATASASGSTLGGFDRASSLVAQLEVTAASGTTPTLDVVLEDTVDGTTFNTVATFTQATGVTRSVQRVTAPFTNRLRARYTIAGTTPSFTFNVKVYSEAV